VDLEEELDLKNDTITQLREALKRNQTQMEQEKGKVKAKLQKLREEHAAVLEKL
jgi:hypothetical protein